MINQNINKIFLSLVLLVVMLFINLRSLADELVFSSKWLECKKHEDCVVFTGVCGEKRCVSEAHKKEAKQYYSQVDFCTPGDNYSQDAQAACIKEQCACIPTWVPTGKVIDKDEIESINP